MSPPTFRKLVERQLEVASLSGEVIGVMRGIVERLLELPLADGASISQALACSITFICVCYAWVFFRSTDLPSALQIVKGMSGGYGITLPQALADRLPGLTRWGNSVGIEFYLGGGGRFIEIWTWILVAGSIAFRSNSLRQTAHR